MNGERRYSGNVVVAFKDLERIHHLWQVQAVVSTPIGERYYVEYIRDYDHLESDEPILSPKLLDNIAKVIIDRSIGDDDLIPTIKTERFAALEVDEKHLHLGESIYVGRKEDGRWPR